MVIFGGGITGLTAAHELVERGFEVKVVEQAINNEGRLDCDVGGMARSQYTYAYETGEDGPKRDMGAEAFRAPKIAFPIEFQSGSHELAFHSAPSVTGEKQSGESPFERILREARTDLGANAEQIGSYLEFRRRVFVVEVMRMSSRLVWNLYQEEYKPSPAVAQALAKVLNIEGYVLSREEAESQGQLVRLEPAKRAAVRAALDKQTNKVGVGRAGNHTPEELKAIASDVLPAAAREVLAAVRAWFANEVRLRWMAYTLIVSREPSFGRKDRLLTWFLFDYFRRRRPEYTRQQFAEEYGLDPADLETAPPVTFTMNWVAIHALNDLPRSAVQDMADQCLGAVEPSRGARKKDQPRPKLKIELHGYADPDFDPSVPGAPLQMTAYKLAIHRAVAVRTAVSGIVHSLLSEPEAGRPTGAQILDGIEISVFGHAEGQPQLDGNGDPKRVESPQVRYVEARLGLVRLPGEHGYRFFPGFYRHVFDTMKRTPVYDTLGNQVPGRTVFDNLVSAEETSIASSVLTGERKGMVNVRRTRLKSIEAVRLLRERLLRDLEVTDRDMLRFELKLFQYLTSSSARRTTYEEKSWLEYLEVENDLYSPAFVQQLESLPVALVGMRARDADARTYGNMVMQLMMDHVHTGAPVDMTLNGPTSEAWFEHWRTYLEHQGVEFYLGELVGFRENPGGLEVMFGSNVYTRPGPDRTATLNGMLYHPKTEEEVPPEQVMASSPLEPSHYLVAVDVETAQRVCRPLPAEEDIGALLAMPLARAEGEGFQAPHLAMNDPLAPAAPLQPFSGVQLYFRENLRFFRGHIYYLDSPWGLTSISQTQFWPSSASGRSKYLTVLSVDIGNWYKGVDRVWTTREAQECKKVWECSKTELAEEVWEQIKRSLPRGDTLPAPIYFHVDDNLKYYSSRDGTTSEVFADLVEYAGRRDSTWPITVAYSLTGDDGHPQRQLTRSLADPLEALRWTGHMAPAALDLPADAGDAPGPVLDWVSSYRARIRIARALRNRAVRLQRLTAPRVRGRLNVVLADLSSSEVESPDDLGLILLSGAAWVEPVRLTEEAWDKTTLEIKESGRPGEFDPAQGRPAPRPEAIQSLPRVVDRLRRLVAGDFDAEISLSLPGVSTSIRLESPSAAGTALAFADALLAPGLVFRGRSGRVGIQICSKGKTPEPPKWLDALEAHAAIQQAGADQRIRIHLPWREPFEPIEAPAELVKQYAWALLGHDPRTTIELVSSAETEKVESRGIFSVHDALAERIRGAKTWPILLRSEGTTIAIMDEEQARLVTERPREGALSDFKIIGGKAGKLRENRSPYLITPKGHWKHRPGEAVQPDQLGGYSIGTSNIVLAGTYMKTFTRLTTMESANESARHAVNAILKDVAGAGQVATPCDIWDPEENELEDVAFLKRLDQDLFDQGLPHFMEILDLDRLPDLMFPTDRITQKGQLARELLGRIVADDMDVLPRAAADAMRTAGKELFEMVKDYAGIQLDKWRKY